MKRKQKKMLIGIIAAAVLTAVILVLEKTGVLTPGRVPMFFIYLVPYLIIGYDVLIKAVKGIARGQILDENFLMCIATVGALALGLLKTGDYLEAVAVMLFYQIGELFQSVAVGKSRKNITALMDIRPDFANVEDASGALVQVDPDEVAVGTVIVVQPGEKVPIDGVVLEGTSSLNTSPLTGESVPVDVGPGVRILSGSVNMTGLLKLRTDREFGESTVSKILDLVENASSRKSRSENFIARFARIYTPAVCISALVLAVLPPLFRLLILKATADWTVWLYRALSFLVASCPCALVVSIPLSFFAGLGCASKNGILIKGSNYLEALAKAGTVVFDKTGTLTVGNFEVTSLRPYGISEERLLELGAIAELPSSHPIGQSLLRAYSKTFGAEPDRSRLSDFEVIAGKGIRANVDGRPVFAGNARLMAELGLGAECSGEAHTGTAVYVCEDGEYRGCILISDSLKPTSKAAIAELKRSGVDRTVILSGDRQAAAQQAADALGIDSVRAELLPGDKVAEVESMLSDLSGSGKKLVYVGDGINDAPVLSRADIGISMGAMGSDAAIEAADIVLMDDDPLKLPLALRISRKCIRIVYENIIFAIAVKLLSLLLVALGVAGMWLAIFADVGVMVLAVLNAIRALFIRRN